MPVELTESLLGNAAGWDVMKRARAYIDQGQVLSSYWAPPLLRGVVQAGEISFRASMVIKGEIDIENLCTCRDAREWGKICAHGVAVGLHWIRSQRPAVAAEPPSKGASPKTAAVSVPLRKTLGLRRDPNGESAELFFILPPNVETALGRGKIMVVVESKWAGGRCPLNALPKGRAFSFSEQDSAILDHLETITQGETPAILQLNTSEFSALLPLMIGHPGITQGKSSSIVVRAEGGAIPVKAVLESNGEISVTSAAGKNLFPVAGGDWGWRDGAFQRLALPEALRGASGGSFRIPRAQVPQFLNRDWPSLLAAGAEANFRMEDFTLQPQAPRFHLELKGGLAQLQAWLQCAYGPRIMTVGVSDAGEGVWLPDPEVPTRYSTRDISAERAALGRLQRQGFSAPDSQGKMQLLGQSAVLSFFAREFPRLEREWTVTMEERLDRSSRQNIERIEPRFEVTHSGVQWFDLGIVFESSGGERFSPAEIQRLILSGQGHTRLRNGKVAVIDTGAVEELQEVLLDCAPQQHSEGYRISNAQAGFLESALREHSGWKFKAPSAFRERAAKQSGETKLECPPLGNLEDVLRPYQKQGVAWLSFLRENHFGGILADEMGLGKTLQTLAFLRSLRGAGDAAGRPHLIVCPTSLVFNWLSEAGKFTPELKVLALQGAGRHADFTRIREHDIVVTSYALIRRDAERYRELEFDTVVLDEAQHIKNRQTQNAQAVKAVRSLQRLVLTGTPLENSVLDLWSIFDFLMPGYLGTAKDFRERYELPITKEKSEEAQARLAKRLRPFMLRRLKREVAADLPEKMEQVAFCELTPDQRSVYEQLIDSTRKEVLSATGEQGQGRSRMLVLNALLRLRQVCCDLRLLNLERVNPDQASGKLDLFSELLEEVLDGGHRVLVFSQFVSMLTLLKERLAAEGIEFCYLDGATQDRAAVVQRFQGNEQIPVFLISLKAGGVGLNLTGADTVIHFDPWWNPAVEDQATDRAHRIGQRRVVTSYKLITRDTVEEKILKLQNRKREVIRATLGSEDEFAASISWEELNELLA